LPLGPEGGGEQGGEESEGEGACHRHLLRIDRDFAMPTDGLIERTLSQSESDAKVVIVGGYDGSGLESHQGRRLGPEADSVRGVCLARISHKSLAKSRSLWHN
jgi:hypothetical protein